MDLKDQLAANEALPKRVRKGRPLPKQIYPKELERTYAKWARAIVEHIKVLYAPVLAELARQMPRTDRARRSTNTHLMTVADIVPHRKDAADAKAIADLLAETKDRLRKSLDEDRMAEFLKRHEERTGAWSKKEFTKQARAAVGVDVFAFDPRQRERAAGFVQANVALIKNLSEETANKMNATIMRAVQDGKSYDDIADDLKNNYAMSADRATLIARDQTGKLYGQINADTQKALGLKKFTWRTSNDERVRPEHQALEGQVFSYDDPPDEGLPGEAIQCRCHAEPYFDDLLPKE